LFTLGSPSLIVQEFTYFNIKLFMGFVKVFMVVTFMTTWSPWSLPIDYCSHIVVHQLAMVKSNLDLIVEFVGHDHFVCVVWIARRWCNNVLSWLDENIDLLYELNIVFKLLHLVLTKNQHNIFHPLSCTSNFYNVFILFNLTLPCFVEFLWNSTFRFVYGWKHNQRNHPSEWTLSEIAYWYVWKITRKT